MQDLLRGRAGFGGAAVDLADVGGGGLGALRDVLDAAGDLLGRCALLLDPLAIDEAMLEIWPMVAPISLIAATDSCVASCMPEM